MIFPSFLSGCGYFSAHRQDNKICPRFDGFLDFFCIALGKPHSGYGFSALNCVPETTSASAPAGSFVCDFALPPLTFTTAVFLAWLVPISYG
jgi:hypothetical protein